VTTKDPDEERRKAQLRAKVFGDVLPETTSDERDRGEADSSSGDSSDEWLKRQVPPHHG
jgi:hypothetical protein